MSASIRKKLEGKTSKLSAPREELADHPAALNNFTDGQFTFIPTEKINPDPNQPRQTFDPESLRELSGSILKQGLLQPVIVRIDENKKIWLIAGERRFRAAKMANISELPAIIRNHAHPEEIALIENIQREDLKPIEEAAAYARLMKKHNYSHRELSEVLGKSKSTITQTLSLTKLPDEIKKVCLESDVPKRLLVEIARKDTPAEMIKLFEQVQSGSLNSESIRQAVVKKPRSPKRTPAAIAYDKIFDIIKTLENLDLNTVEESERIRLITSVKTLKDMLEQKILN